MNFSNCGSGGIRTHDIRMSPSNFKSPSLYLAEPQTPQSKKQMLGYLIEMKNLV